jgi:nicotinamidase-related amidase
MSENGFRRLDKDNCALVVVDIQERLMPQIHEHARVNAQSAKLIQGANILDIPIIWTEQYRKGLGGTTPEVIAAIGDAAEPMEKMTFGCLDDDTVRDRVASLGRKTLVLCGIEAHICVAQTALRAMDDGYQVVLVEDAVSSRRARDCETGIARLRQAGVVPATVEMLFMEWMQVAGTTTFKKMLPLLKD